MQWYNEDKSKMIDLDKVDAYDYVPKGGMQRNSSLDLVINGYEMHLGGEQADEIYNKLQSTREVI